MRKTLQFACLVMLALFSTNVWADTLDHARHVFVAPANTIKNPYLDDNEYNAGQGDYIYDYYIKADGGGLNQLHITDAYGSPYGDDYDLDAEGGSASGSFYITTTGGRGYNDEIILMISVKPDGQGQIPSNLAINIQTSGYEFDLSDYTNPTYDSSGINETFYASDFSADGYGLHTYKPGPNNDPNIDLWVLPLYTDQTDFTNGEQLLFVDLHLGNIRADLIEGETDGAAVKVTYSITGLDTAASFSAYAWCYESNQLQGISWTTDTVDAYGTSSYRLTYLAP